MSTQSRVSGLASASRISRGGLSSANRPPTSRNTLSGMLRSAATPELSMGVRLDARAGVVTERCVAEWKGTSSAPFSRRSYGRGFRHTSYYAARGPGAPSAEMPAVVAVVVRSAKSAHAPRPGARLAEDDRATGVRAVLDDLSAEIGRAHV